MLATRFSSSNPFSRLKDQIFNVNVKRKYKVYNVQVRSRETHHNNVSITHIIPRILMTSLLLLYYYLLEFISVILLTCVITLNAGVGPA